MFLVVVSGYFTGDIWGYNQMFCVVYIYIYIHIYYNEHDNDVQHGKCNVGNVINI